MALYLSSLGASGPQGDSQIVFFHFGVFSANTTVSSPRKFAEVLSHVDATCDIEDTIQVDVDDGCVLMITDTTEHIFFSDDSEQTNTLKSVGFTDNIRTTFTNNMTVGGNKKVGYTVTPKDLERTALSYYTPTAVDYDSSTGDMVLTIGTHSLTTSSTLRVAPYGLRFSCSKDNHATTHAYPRTTDPQYNKNVTIKAVTDTTATINIGASPAKNYDVTSAVYQPVTGVLQLQIGTHTLTTSDTISIPTGGITFSCGQDSHATNHAYPRSSDPANNVKLAITAVSSNTISVNVGVSPNTSDHVYISSVANAVQYNDQYTHTFISADPNVLTSGGWADADADDLSIDIEDTIEVIVDDQAVLVV